MEQITVLVADDHTSFREGLSRFICEQEDMTVIGEAENGKEAISLACSLHPDVAMVDVAMPELNGIEAAKQIKRMCPNTGVIMVSAFGYEAYMISAIEAGAGGYMLKNASIADLINAIRLVHKGEAVFNLQAIKRLAQRDSLQDQDKASFSRLSNRELDVIKSVANGHSNKEIASQFGISERTVQTHLVNIYKKLGVNSRTEAVLRAIKNGGIIVDDLP